MGVWRCLAIGCWDLWELWMAKNYSLCWNVFRITLVLKYFWDTPSWECWEFHATGEVQNLSFPSATGLSLIMLEVKMNHLWASVDTWVGPLCKLVFCWCNKCDSLLVVNINVTERKLGWFAEEIRQTFRCFLLRSRYLCHCCASDTSTCRRKMEGECFKTLLSLDSGLRMEIISQVWVYNKKLPTTATEPSQENTPMV